LQDDLGRDWTGHTSPACAPAAASKSTSSGARQFAELVSLPALLVGLQAPSQLPEQELPVRTRRLLAEELAVLFA
jgi:hypothetical protein